MPASTLALDTVRYRVTGMDCSSCATKIEKAARQVPGVAEVKVSIASQEMELRVDDPVFRPRDIEQTVTGLGYQLARVDAGGNADDEAAGSSHVTPAYKRALWIVVLLNAGYGLIEIVGGFLAGSQALKADALDFIGDGLISWLGLMAVGWGLAARAKAALLQGIFLALLGVGVFAATLYRVFILNIPQAELMGLFGIVALVVNVLAVVVLLPHRAGDSNVRAVWLFSRNDALGNVAVVIAAGLVAWTGTPWPDLAVAAIVAGLFLQSAWSIIRDARGDLRRAKGRF